MTAPASLRFNVNVPFPAMVQGSGPVTIAKSNGVWTVGFSVSQLGNQNPPPFSNLPTDSVFVWDSVAKQFILVSIGSLLQILPPGRIEYVLRGINFNSANSDNQIPISLPPGVSNYQVENLSIANASASISTATWGLFSAAAGGGTAIFAAGQAITVTSAAANTNNNSQTVAPATVGTESYNFATLFFRVGTAQGSAATADVIIGLRPL